MKINFRKTTGNKQVDSGKIEGVDIILKICRKIRERKLISENLRRNCWWTSNIQKEKMIENFLLPQCHSILPYSNNLIEEAWTANKVRRLFKCFIITILYFFLFTKKLTEFWFPKGVLIYQEKTTATFIGDRNIHFLGNLAIE